MLRRQIQAGKIRYLSISLSNRIDPVYQSEHASQVGASAIQVNYNRLDRTPEQRVLPACLEQGLGVLARVPYGQWLIKRQVPAGYELCSRE